MYQRNHSPSIRWLLKADFSNTCIFYFLQGHGQHEQTTEASTDTKDYDGVWETGGRKQYSDFKSGVKLYILISDFIVVSVVRKWWEFV